MVKSLSYDTVGIAQTSGKPPFYTTLCAKYIPVLPRFFGMDGLHPAPLPRIFLFLLLPAMVGDSFNQSIQNFATFDFWLSKLVSDRL